MRRLLRSWRDPLRLFLATRIPVLVVMYLSLVVMPVPDKPGLWRDKPDNLFIDGWFRWDAAWYMHIARDGYWNTPNGDGQSDVAFWPLFPLLTRGIASVFSTTDIPVVMFWLNHVLLLGCTYFLFHLVRERHGAAIAKLATILFLTYPYSLYYSAGYSEPTFMFFTFGAFYFAHRERWAAASILAGIGSASRGVAVIASASLLFLYLEKYEWRPARIRANALWLVVGFAGFAGYTYFLYRTFGDPFAYVKSFTAKGWGADVSMQRLREATSVLSEWAPWPRGFVRVQDLMSLFALLGVLLVTVVGIRARPIGETIFALGSIALYAKMWPTAGRYVGSIFPAYITLAQTLRPRPNAELFVRTSFVTTLALFIMLFGHWAWVSG